MVSFMPNNTSSFFSRDPTQAYLIQVLHETEEILLEALKTLDINSKCQIIAAADLGFPHDVIRLAGGFATGCFVEWQCSEPFIPVDTTVNIDTSSVYKLEENIIDSITEETFQDLVNKLEKSSYINNFQKGNHFISFGVAIETGEPYLVIHSNEKEFKYQFNGLMPVDGNWFMDDVITYSKGARYIRFLTGRKAELFSDIAKSLEQYNIMRHRFIANFISDFCGIKSVSDTHHYFMPSKYSVALGCFLAEPGDILPIFSAPGKNIHLYKVSSGGENSLDFINGGDSKLLVPHGWGKRAKSNPKIEWDNKNLIVNDISFPIEPLESLGKHPDLIIRDYSTNLSDSNNYFSQISSYCPGEVILTIEQKASFCRQGFLKSV
jgi:hypothetical protein